MKGLQPPSQQLKTPKALTRTWSSMEVDSDKRICKFDLIIYPCADALQHPLAEILLEYASNGCPADCGAA